MQSMIKCLTAALFLFGPAMVQAGDLAAIQKKLEAAVRGRWQIETNSTWTYLAPKELPPTLEQGTYCIFVADGTTSSTDLARGWMEICQAPFFILGTNTDCTVVTYAPRNHPVSQAIIKALGLKEMADKTSLGTGGKRAK